MRNDITDLKKLTQELIKDEIKNQPEEKTQLLIDKIYGKQEEQKSNTGLEFIDQDEEDNYQSNPTLISFDDAETIEETVSLQEKEIEMIKHALDRNKGKRKLAAKELGISERTLYRKINQYNL
jgi:DNA-binding NtrC family response regulator